MYADNLDFKYGFPAIVLGAMLWLFVTAQDNGSANLRVGFAGREKPLCSIPSCIGKPTHKVQKQIFILLFLQGLLNGLRNEDTYIGGTSKWEDAITEKVSSLHLNSFGSVPLKMELSQIGM